MLGLLQVPIQDTDQAIRTFRREKRIELGTSGVRHQDQRVTTKRRWADARDALKLPALRSLQREPPSQRAVGTAILTPTPRMSERGAEFRASHSGCYTPTCQPQLDIKGN